MYHGIYVSPSNSPNGYDDRPPSGTLSLYDSLLKDDSASLTTQLYLILTRSHIYIMAYMYHGIYVSPSQGLSSPNPDPISSRPKDTNDFPLLGDMHRACTGQMVV